MRLPLPNLPIKFNLASNVDIWVRLVAAWMVAAIAIFLVNSYLVYWRGWPQFFISLSAPAGRGWLQIILYGSVIAAITFRIIITADRTLPESAKFYADVAAYIIRAAFWAVLLIGLVDMLISVLRVESVLASVVGESAARQLGRPVFRGLYIHYPLIFIALIIARFVRGNAMIWLSFLVVMAEFQVVISRFVFSYEQAFMGDLVRFWYAALFLFASSYTLANEGHVRVDVLYANFTVRGKAWANAGGAILLGLPFCWTILLQGLAGKGASIVSPLLGFEISQSGYGMYVKYLMAGFLLIFAVSMALQFTSSVVANIGVLRENRHH